jgi:hypothetical protein
MRANPTTGVITGALYGSNQILCGNFFSTQVAFTEWSALTFWSCVGFSQSKMLSPKPTGV